MSLNPHRNYWFLLVLFSCAATSVLAQTQPNVIVILADDLGYADLSYTGATEFETPNLDRLAQGGVEFTMGYANHPFCSPTRAALMTGRYQHRFGYETNVPNAPRYAQAGLPVTEVTIAERLKEVGYTTGLIGKWHLGASPAHHPLNRGFDTFFGMIGGGHQYFETDTTRSDTPYFGPLVDNHRYANVEGYLTHQLTDHAINFIETNREGPFFLFLSYNAPHGPFEAPQETIAELSHIENQLRRTYAAMVVEMDRDIGRVVERIEELGLAENTLVIFQSDNGGPTPGYPGVPETEGTTDNSPYRGGKAEVYEGGIHVPFLAYWPGQIEPGTTYPYPVLSIDITRTVAEVAGATSDGMEGVDLIASVTADPMVPAHEYVFFRRRDNCCWAIVDQNGMKLVKPSWETPARELYNLASDPGETRNLFAAQPEEVARLQAAYDAWNADNIRYTFEGFIEYRAMLEEMHGTIRAGVNDE